MRLEWSNVDGTLQAEAEGTKYWIRQEKSLYVQEEDESRPRLIRRLSKQNVTVLKRHARKHLNGDVE